MAVDNMNISTNHKRDLPVIFQAGARKAFESGKEDHLPGVIVHEQLLGGSNQPTRARIIGVNQ